MLQSLTVKNFAIIDNLCIDFNEGFTAITGETGAGKSLLIDAIGLLLGDRASASMVRTGEQKATIEGVFTNLGTYTKELLEEYNLLEDDLLIIRKEIFSNGKSLVRVNGAVVTMNQIIQLGQTLADIHTQNDTKKLFEPKNYLSFIDDQSTILLLKEYQKLRNVYLDAQKEYEELTLNIENYHKEKEYLEYQYQMLLRADLKKGELEKLESEYNLLNNYELIFKNLSNIKKDFDDNNINTTLYEISNALEKLGNIDTKYQKLSEVVQNAYYDLKDVASEVGQKLNNLEFNQDYFNELIERINFLKDLKYKYKMPVEEIINYRDSLKNKLEILEDDDYIQKQMKEKVEEYYKLALDKAINLSQLRKENANKLVENIRKTLCDLMLNKVQINFVFTSNLNQNQKNSLLKNGIDIVNIMISFNPGEKMMDLSKIASGGEMSRVMLAIKTHLIANYSLSTIIFDEIDSGVSGEVAYQVAQKLKSISKHTQVLAITHLPIVASQSDTQLLITKKIIDNKTITMIKELNDDERIEELAKMISPTDKTGKSKELAKNMIYRQ